MMYDENCFERWSERMESDYLSQDFEPKTCCECGDYATEQVNGDWYCEDCLKEIEE